jgi:peptidoglycan/LPS O-acetylase OafA/YrhL
MVTKTSVKPKSVAAASYRPDIDGLRGIAVLAVVLYHGFPTRIAGGFVGVDIFFVISGFLISGIIIEASERNKFSFLDFYARRIRRIFPALGLVLFACLSFGWLFLFPDEYQQLGKYVGGGAGFIGNLVTLTEAGYFDTKASLKPLLHLWSLGVEEQFYIVWPTLIYFSYKWRHGPIVFASGILVISFIFNVVVTATEPTAAFYLPITRFWELMMGCLLAIFQSRYLPLIAVMRSFKQDELTRAGWNLAEEVVAALGLGLIFAAIIMISANNSFPGFWAVLPTSGAFLLIAIGRTTLIGQWLLGSRPLVYVGLISYPLYLWHWPILSFARILNYEEPSRLVRSICIVGAFLLAELTYRFVERPIRFGPRKTAKAITVSAVLTCAGSLGVAIFAYGGVPSRFPGEAQLWVRNFQAEETAKGAAHCFIDPGKNAEAFTKDCDGSTDKRLKIVLWGDSHAAHLVPGLLGILEPIGDYSLARYTASGCPPVLKFVTARIPNCTSINDFVVRKITKIKPTVAILAGRWDLYDGSAGVERINSEMIQTTVKELKSAGVKHIIAIGQMPVWEVPPPKILARGFRTAVFNRGDQNVRFPMYSKTFLSPSTFTRNDEIGRDFEAAGATFVDPLSTFCNDDGCMLVVPGTNGEPIEWDEAGHLTAAGAEYFMSKNATTIFHAINATLATSPLRNDN